MNILSLLSSFASLIFIFMGLYALKLEPRSRLNRIFFAITFCASLWSLSYAFIYSAASEEECRAWHRVSAIGWSFMPALFAHFAMVFTRSGRPRLRALQYLALYAPALVFMGRSLTGVITTSGFTRTPLGWTDVMVYDTAWYAAFISYVGLYMAFGIALFLRRAHGSDTTRERKQARTIGWTATVTMALVLVSEQLLPYFGIYSVPVLGHLLMLITGAGVWYAIVRYRLMSIDSAVASERIVDLIRDFIILLDPAGRIVRANRPADTILGHGKGKLAGRTLAGIVRRDDSFPEKLRTLLEGKYSAHRMELDFTSAHGETIPVDTLFSVIRDGSGAVIGILVVGHDLRETRQRLREAREGEQRESEERFRTLVSHSSDIISIIDNAGIIRYVSPSVINILNYDPADLAGKNTLDFIHPDEVPTMRKFFLVLLRNPGRISSRKLRLRSSEGDWRLFDVNFKNLLEDPAIRGIVVNFRDITERKEYENQLREYRQNLEVMVHQRTEELSRANEQLTREIAERREAEARLREHSRYLLALHNTALSIIDRLDIMELLHTVVENASLLLNAPHGYLALTNDEGTALVTRVGIGVFNTRIGDAFIPGQGLCGSVWASAETMPITSYRDYPNRVPGTDLDALGAMVAAPLKSQGKVMGVIGMGRDGGNGSFDDSEIAILTRFAELASLALDNAMLYDRLQQELAERRRAEESLWESNQKYRTILESIEDGYYEVDLRGAMTFMNSSLCRILGYAMEELMHMDYRKYMDQKNKAEVFRVFNQVFSDGRPRKSFEWELIRKDGQHIVVDASVSLITDRQGRRTGFRGVLRDISERKQFEQSLKFLAHHDVLTGLPNRILFIDRLEQAIAQAGRNFSLMAVLFLDLDNFKEVNDGLGHDAGDQLLKEAAGRLQESIREIDTVARFGGDEFIFILPDIKSVEYAEKVVRRIHASFERPFLLKGSEIRISPSMGVAFYPIDSDNADTLLKKADMAQYRAKESGKNNFKFYSATMQK